MPEKSPVVTLMKFFGRRPGQGIADFKKECDALSNEEKQELANLAAAELEENPDIAGFQPL